MNNNENLPSRCIFLGDSNSGKTSILSRKCNESADFDSYAQPSVAVSYVKIVVNNIPMSIFDTAGQERFNSMTSTYCRDATNAIIVFDLTSSNSFQNVEKWYQKVTNEAENLHSVFIVGNKLDLTDQRQVEFEVAERKAEELKATYFETSALRNEGIDDLFYELSQKMDEVNHLLLEKVNEEVAVDITKSENESNGKKCC
ncbi:GTP-binding protein ryh1 [Tritrichomonas foetus]|uniref:GTP-binding protein ryh1 n=1 Tax=Tritrichomonas foetus TaxID=1144522 RepID=A0A1J4KFI2_9EUKA|nr:GTP-binding protein ryh1 [Tritrichomonas foetus]|eukprot:OHT09794.1 GTP-binding protein ryh1 [Tritrichomonas foetus]